MKVSLSSKADRQLMKLPRPAHSSLIAKIKMLSDDPYSWKAVKLADQNVWRVRDGDYRILYTIDKRKKEVSILSIAHRRDVYR